MTKYIDRTEIEGFGDKLFIYKRTDLNNDVWHYRAKINGEKNYIRRSTKHKNTHLAIQVALNEYIDLLAKKQNNVALGKIRVKHAVEKWFVVIKKQKESTRYNYQRNTWFRCMHEYFGEEIISELSDAYVAGYWSFRLSYYYSGPGKDRDIANERRVGAKTKSSKNIAKTPSYATLKAEASIINEFLRWAAGTQQGYLLRELKIRAADATTKEQRTLGVRATFDRDEWRVLTRNLFEYALVRGKRFGDDRVSTLHKLQRQQLRTFVLLLSSSGLRVGEAAQLRWNDISTVHDADENKYVTQINVRAKTSKTRKSRAAFSLGNNVKWIDDWREQTEFSGNDDLIFYAKTTDGTQKRVDMSNTFKTFLKRVDYLDRREGLHKNGDGKNRTLYSLRHYYATSRIESGVEIYTLAKVMGTAVKNIELHYGHVANDMIIKEATKTKYLNKNNERANDIKYAADMIHSLRNGDITEADLILKISAIAKG